MTAVGACESDWLPDQALGLLGAQVITLDENDRVLAVQGATLLDITPGQDLASALPFVIGLLGEDQIDIGPLLIEARDGPADGSGEPLPLHLCGERQPGQGYLLTLRETREAWRLEQRLMQSRNDLAITNRRLVKALQAAHEASESKTRFLSSISHDLRTPISIIIGNGELLSGEPSLNADPVRGDMVSDINEQAQALLGLVDELLDTAAAEAGKVAVRNEIVDLNELLEHVLRSFMGQATAAGITLSLEIGTLPMLALDPRRFIQVLNNLLSNALNYTQRGGTVLLKAEVTMSGDVRIGVLDTGIGIPAAEVGRLGEPFYTTSNRPVIPTARSSGLGLHNAKRILSVYGGLLTIESTQGFGTSAWAQLPSHLAAAN